MKVVIVPNPVVLADVGEQHLDMIRKASGGGEIVVTKEMDDQLREIRDADVFAGTITPELFRRAEQLRWVQALSSGTDEHLFPEFAASDVYLTSEKGIVGTHLAEQGFALLLAFTRNVAWAVREKSWKSRMPMRRFAWELTGLTMGIVGLGGTGVEMARRAEAFGMRNIAVDPEDVKRPDFVEEVWKMDKFDDLLAESDVVAICCPLTDATRGMFNLDAFNKMKRRSILINVTRGPIVDEESLVQALQQGLIAGAGLDVLPREPLPEDHPLWSMDNAVITPHVAGASPYRPDRVVSLFCENLERLRAGRELIGVIDKKKGY
jgi:phosphoglycerate dehydrogenase-like enzyme